MILLPEQMRRINDIGSLMEQKLPGLPEYHVLLINKNHPLAEGILKFKNSSILIGTDEKSPNSGLADEIARQLYDLAKLSLGALDSSDVAEFQIRNTDLMGKLIAKAA